MKVLIIDDDADIRLIACLALTRVGGMTAVEADSGLAGLRKAREERPDVVLLDMMMPMMDGCATLAALRADPALARRYAQLKRDLARRYRDDRIAYTEAKTEFVEEALRKWRGEGLEGGR